MVKLNMLCKYSWEVVSFCSLGQGTQVLQVSKVRHIRCRESCSLQEVGLDDLLSPFQFYDFIRVLDEKTRGDKAEVLAEAFRGLVLFIAF